MTQDDFYTKLQRRIAQMAVGTSSLRNQGGSGLIKICRDYFEQKIELDEFFEVLPDETKFIEFLNNHTNELVKLFPETAKSWGAARKGLNLFLRDIAYNKYFADKYKIPSALKSNNEALKNLEVPLDKDVATGLEKHYDTSLPKWKGIKHLKPDDSKIFQQKAQELGKKKSIARVHLDLEFWRNNKKQ